MARIPEAKLDETDARVRRDLEAQADYWGAPLKTSLIYAHNPTLYPAVRGMWKALAASGKIDPGFGSLVNRRVAALNGCVF